MTLAYEVLLLSMCTIYPHQKGETDMSEKRETKEEKTTKKRTAKGESYECEVCGLAVTVDEVCGCVSACDIICCGKPMKERKSAKAKVTK